MAMQAGFTGMACGAAMYGLKPVLDFMTWNFSMQVRKVGHRKGGERQAMEGKGLVPLEPVNHEK